MNRTIPPWVSTLLRYLFAVVAIAIIVTTIDTEVVVSTLGSADPVWVLVTIAASFAAFFVNAVKWAVLVRARGVDAPIARLYRLTLVSMLYGTVLPGQVAGDAVRAVRLGRTSGDMGVAAASVVFDRVIGMLTLVSVGCAAALLAPNTPAAVVVILVGGAAAAILGVVVIMRLGAPSAINAAPDVTAPPPPAGRSNRIRVAAVKARTALGAYRHHRSALAHAFLLGIVVQLTATAQTWTAARAIGADVHVLDLAWTTAVVVIVTFLPLTVASIGPREGAFVALLGTRGVESSAALSISVLVLAGQLAVALSGGILELLPDRRQESHGSAGKSSDA